MDATTTENATLPAAYRSTIDRLYLKCNQANIQLVFLAPPTFSSVAEMQHYQQMTNYLQQKDISVLAINDPVLYDATLYYDYRHFNRNGARLYSVKLAKALSELVE